jgi:hypothetical protein
MQGSEQGYRRSSHAEDRKREGKPIRNAFTDVQTAKPNDIFIQLDGRYIVRGPKGREHIFEPTGELVTSLHRSSRAHLLKLQAGELYSVTEEQFGKFQEIFR